MIAAPNDTALATRLQLFCGTLDTRVTSPRGVFSRPMTDRPIDRPRWGEYTLPRSSSVNTRVERAFLLFKKYRGGLTPRAGLPAQSFFYQTALDWQSPAERNSLERRDNAWHLGTASIRRLHALDNPRNAPVTAVDLREVTLQSRPLPGVGERSAILLAKENLSRAGNLRSRITYRDSLKLDRALSRPPKEQNVFRIEIFTTWNRQRNIVNRLIPIVNACISGNCANVIASEFYCEMGMENPFNN
ncbi:hypothetical protein G5I_00143 [Acromyrmex echinatior]|uniref:Uncharacterized protein n=1 Tax=Acromyrmex echinatior TaxID=103372 RepID=F4W438_ACREC|nr:hypothetical protein G5I_00143 [Acromyrmex echinatior]